MNDLISRQAAIEAICEHGTELERGGITVLAVANHKQATVDLLESLPSAQPEIVHCKDCKHRPKEVEGSRYLEFPDGECICQCDDPWYEWMPDDDFYCANAERRTDE